MKATRATALRITVLACVVAGGGWIVRNAWWPSGSSNMFVVTDGTPVQAIIVCADKGEVLWQIVSVGAAGQPKAVPYGEVPPGFRQEMPREGTPRPFIRNESLEVHVLSQTADMGDGGRATGPA